MSDSAVDMSKLLNTKKTLKIKKEKEKVNNENSKI